MIDLLQAYGYGYYGGGAAYAGLATFMATMGLIALLIGPIFYVLTSLGLMKIFEKAGVEGKWRAWIPFYNTMVLMKLGDVNPWLAFFAFASPIPVIGQILAIGAAVLMFIAAYRVGVKLGKPGAMVVLAIFLFPVWAMVLGFGKSLWNPTAIAPASWAGNGFFGDRSVWQGIPVQPGAQARPQQPAYGQQPGYPQPGYPQQPPAYGQPQAPQQPYGQPQAPQYPPAAPQQAPQQPPQAPQQPPAAPTQPPAAPQQPPQPPQNPDAPQPPAPQPPQN